MNKRISLLLMCTLFLTNCGKSKYEKQVISKVFGEPRDFQFVSFSPDHKGLTYVIPAIKDVLTPWTICINNELVSTYDFVSFQGWIKSADSTGTEYIPLYSVSSGKKAGIILGQTESEKYELLGSDQNFRVLLSKDSTSYAYWARADSLEFMVVNSVAGEKFERVGRPFFAPDNRTVAYKALRARKWFIVFGEKKFGPYEAVGQPVISPDGVSVAFITATGGKWVGDEYIGGKWCVVVNGKPQRTYDWVWNPTFSADGKHIAYRASNGGGWNNKTYQGGSWFVVVDGKEGKRYDGVGDPVFSPAKNIVTYVATQKNKWVLVFGENEIGAFDYIDRFKINFVGKSDNVTFVASNGGRWEKGVYYGGKWFVMFNDKKGKEFDCIWIPPVLDTLQTMVGYVGSDGGKWDTTGYSGGSYFAVLSDGSSEIVSSPLPLVRLFMFSPYVRASYALLLQIQENSFVILYFDGDKTATSLPCDEVQSIRFVPDSKKLLAAVKRQKRWHLVSIEGSGEKVLSTYDFIGDITPGDDGKSAKISIIDYKKKTSFLVELPLKPKRD